MYGKYITTKNGQMVIFSKEIPHESVAEKLSADVVSAGLISIVPYKMETGEVLPIAKCYGESTILGVKAATGDSEIANSTLGLV